MLFSLPVQITIGYVDLHLLVRQAACSLAASVGGFNVIALPVAVFPRSANLIAMLILAGLCDSVSLVLQSCVCQSTLQSRQVRSRSGHDPEHFGRSDPCSVCIRLRATFRSQWEGAWKSSGVHSAARK